MKRLLPRQPKYRDLGATVQRLGSGNGPESYGLPVTCLFPRLDRCGVDHRYVVVITGFGILGKRLGSAQSQTGAITVPDLFRTRFNSPALGFTCTIFILLYLSFMMLAKFKAGAIVIQLAWSGRTAENSRCRKMRCRSLKPVTTLAWSFLP